MDFNDSNRKNILKDRMEKTINALSSMRSFIIGIHLNNVEAWSNYGGVYNEENRHTYMSAYEYPTVSSFMQGLATIVQDSKVRYLIPEKVKNEDVLEGLIDMLYCAGFSFTKGGSFDDIYDENEFNLWIKKLNTKLSKISYCTMIEEHSCEMENRKNIDKNKYLENLPLNIKWKMKGETYIHSYERKSVVLDINTSEKTRINAYKFINTFINSISENYGRVYVEKIRNHINKILMYVNELHFTVYVNENEKINFKIL